MAIKENANVRVPRSERANWIKIGWNAGLATFATIQATRPYRSSSPLSRTLSRVEGKPVEGSNPVKALFDGARLAFMVAADAIATEVIIEEFQKGNNSPRRGLHIGERIRDLAENGIHTKIPFTDKDVTIPDWLAVGGVAGAGAGAIALLHGSEQQRSKTALAEAPEEARLVKQAFDEESQRMTTVKINNVDVPVTASQSRAVDYANKYLAEMKTLKGVNPRQVDDISATMRGLIEQAYDPATPNPLMQDIIKTLAGDAFEHILMTKELPETADKLVERPRDYLFRVVSDLPKIAETTPFIPKSIRKALSEFQPANVQVGEVPVDILDIRGKLAKQTLTKVEDLLKDQFQDDINAELAYDATGAQVAYINGFLHGEKAIQPIKNGMTNTILAMELVKMHPEEAPKVAEIVGVLDALQNAQIKTDLPSKRRRII